MSNNGIDWDGELQSLMESSGIDPRQAIRPDWRIRWRRRIRGARAFLITLAAMVPAMWLVARSGAPSAAVLPLMVWLAGWIGYSIWISLGRPDASTTGIAIRANTTRMFGAVTRFGYAQSRPLRARWRARRVARAATTVTEGV
ncbi:hypothetical protein [Nocardia sp. NPDC050710]|uniref:hypothetical protein n=1 Tax=Nocardia sp. NPDC050710 TaxID=3157220 RepID=UPI0033EB4738